MLLIISFSNEFFGRIIRRDSIDTLTISIDMCVRKMEWWMRPPLPPSSSGEDAHIQFNDGAIKCTFIAVTTWQETPSIWPVTCFRCVCVWLSCMCNGTTPHLNKFHTNGLCDKKIFFFRFFLCFMFRRQFGELIHSMVCNKSVSIILAFQAAHSNINRMTEFAV